MSTNASRLVSGPRLLEVLFDDESRPTLRFLRSLQKRRVLGFYKVGRLVLFDPEEARQDLANYCRVSPRHVGASRVFGVSKRTETEPRT